MPNRFISRRVPPWIGLVLLALLCGDRTALVAERVVIPDHDVTVDLPAAWKAAPLLSPQTVLAWQRSDGRRIFLINAARIPESETGTRLRDMLAAAKDSAAAKGWKILGHGNLMTNGLVFSTVTTRVSPTATITTWMTALGTTVYALEGIDKDGSEATDLDLLGIFCSFRPVSGLPTIPANQSAPASPDPSASPPKSSGPQITYLAGGFLLLAIVALAFIRFGRRRLP